MIKKKLLFLLSIFIKNIIVAQTFYVSTNGKPSNDGSIENPIDIYSAFSSLNPGETYIFEKGTYQYNKKLIINTKSNKALSIISQGQHNAKIIFSWENIGNYEKILVKNSVVTISGFELTQTTQGRPDSKDAIIKLLNSSNCKIINNIIHGSGDDGIKLSQNSNNNLIKDNIIHNIKLDGIDIFNCKNNDVTENYINNCEQSILVKGGSQNIKVYNNYLLSKHNDSNLSKKGISFGGTSGVKKNQVFKYKANESYEAYNCVAYNNIIVGEGTASQNFIHGALRAIGSTRCGYFNNTIVNVNKAFKTNMANEPKYSPFNWKPTVYKPIFINNIIYKCNIAIDLNDLSNSWKHSHNCYYKVFDKNSIYPARGNKYDDPMFINNLENWHLKDESLYISSHEHFGLKINYFKGYNGEKISISKDKEGFNRGNKWVMGAYNNTINKKNNL